MGTKDGLPFQLGPMSWQQSHVSCRTTSWQIWVNAMRSSDAHIYLSKQGHQLQKVACPSGNFNKISTQSNFRPNMSWEMPRRPFCLSGCYIYSISYKISKRLCCDLLCCNHTTNLFFFHWLGLQWGLMLTWMLHSGKFIHFLFNDLKH